MKTAVEQSLLVASSIRPARGSVPRASQSLGLGHDGAWPSRASHRSALSQCPTLDRFRAAALRLLLLTWVGAVFAAESDPTTAALDSAFALLPQIEYGQDYGPLRPLELAVAAVNNNVVARKDLEQRFLRVLKGPATTAAKDYSCRALKLVGQTDSVAALTALLRDQALGGLARDALEANPSPAVDQALRESLPRFSGRLKIGIISSIGVRRDPQAVSRLSPLLQEADPAMAGAAALALGKIATPPAVKALTDYRPKAPEALRATFDGARLEAAQQLLRQGDTNAAGRTAQEVFQEHPAGFLRQASFQILVAAQAKEALTRILEALKSDDAELQLLAGRLAAERPSRQMPNELLTALPQLPPGGQTALLKGVRLCGDPTARLPILPFLNHPNAGVRLAAVEALAVVGNAADILTFGRLAAGQGPESEAARRGLTHLKGPDVNGAIIADLAKADGPIKIQLLRSLAVRSATEVAPAVVPYLADADEKVGRAAVEVLGSIADAQQVPLLVRHLAAAKSDTQRELLADALVAIGGRCKEKATAGLLNGWQTPDKATRIALLRAFSSVGGPPALEAVRAALKDPNPEIKDAAIRALAEWSDVAAAPDLAKIIQTADQVAQRALAFRGFIRLGREAEAPADARLKILAEAMKFARDASEKKLVLGALGDLRTIESLRLAGQYVTNPELADEAGAAAVRIAPLLEAQDQAEANGVLEKVLNSATAKSVLDDVRRQLRGLGSSPPK